MTIIALNEAHRIRDCIESVREISDDIIVLDSGSRDDTRAIAEAAGARVCLQPFLGDGPQKNRAAEFARHDWVLSIDADERATPELRSLLRSLSPDANTFDGYSVRRKTFVGNRWIRRSGWYPDRVVRLYNRRIVRFIPTQIHARVSAGRVGKLDADLLHLSFASASDLIYGQRYAVEQAYLSYKQGQRCNCLKPPIRGAWAFLRSYVVRGGILGGIDGLTVAISAGLNAYMKYAILHEMTRDEVALAQYRARFDHD